MYSQTSILTTLTFGMLIKLGNFVETLHKRYLPVLDTLAFKDIFSSKVYPLKMSVTVKKAISRCVEVFGERNVYPAHIIEEMKTALVSRIATEKDESQNATEIIDFQKIIRAIESFYKNEMLTEKAREILSRSSFNFKESVQGRVKGFFIIILIFGIFGLLMSFGPAFESSHYRNEGIKALADMDSSRQKLISFLDTVEKHKQKGLLLHELMKKTENTFNLQLRDVTVINDAYERFAEGIKKTKEQLETMESSGCMLGESPPRDAPSPTAGDDPFVHGVDGEELAGGGDDMEMDEEDKPGTSGSSRCFLKSANEYTRASMPTGPPIQFNAPPPLNTQFIPLPTQSSGALPPPRPSVMDPRQARFFASQQQQQNYPSIPPPPGASPPPQQQSQINQQQFFNQTNGGDHSTANLSSPPMFNHPPPLIPRTPKFVSFILFLWVDVRHFCRIYGLRTEFFSKIWSIPTNHSQHLCLDFLNPWSVGGHFVRFIGLGPYRFCVNI
ncbi:unnamed protein product [Meloidogyne enterolobii]|uniref:Uncharacterized protein n=1 Tax=Meloidogyne enterolobii TaxID=390850 RepID=A0ACB1AI34_MELEN